MSTPGPTEKAACGALLVTLRFPLGIFARAKGYEPSCQPDQGYAPVALFSLRSTLPLGAVTAGTLPTFRRGTQRAAIYNRRRRLLYAPLHLPALWGRAPLRKIDKCAMYDRAGADLFRACARSTSGRHRTAARDGCRHLIYPTRRSTIVVGGHYRPARDHSLLPACPTRLIREARFLVPIFWKIRIKCVFTVPTPMPSSSRIS